MGNHTCITHVTVSAGPFWCLRLPGCRAKLGTVQTSCPSDPVDQVPGTRHKRVPNAVRGGTSLPPDPKPS